MAMTAVGVEAVAKAVVLALNASGAPARATVAVGGAAPRMSPDRESERRFSRSRGGGVAYN